MELRVDDRNRSALWFILQAAEAGYLSDPATRPFKTWPRSRASRDSLYFSVYQLLALRAWRGLLSSMSVRRDGDWLAWTLDPLPRRTVQLHRQGRSLAIVLEALSPRYRPVVTNVLSVASDQLQGFIRDRDPVPEHQFLRLDCEVLVRQADMLLTQAKSFDPLGNWSRVVRIGSARRWEELRNDALLALDHRIAAELLLLFVEDEARQSRGSPLPPVSKEWREPQHDRLRVESKERAEAAMDFGLSDRPALCVAVEGQTEVIIVQHVLDLWGSIPFPRGSPSSIWKAWTAT
jgi:hypothetical protein